MKGRCIVVFSVVVAAVLPAAGRTAAPIDWIVASMAVPVTAPVQHQASSSQGGSFSIGTDTAGVSLSIAAVGRLTGNRSTVVGSGAYFDGHGFLDAFDFADGGIHVRTTKDLGGLDLEITKKTEGSLHMTSIAAALGPIRRITMVVFLAHGSFDSFQVKGSGGETPEVFTGSGTRAIGVADPESSGVAVDASAVAAGTSTFEATLPGVVGSAVLGGCVRCMLSWTSPDGKTGSFEQTEAPFVPLPAPVPLPVPAVFDGFPGFIGPAGHWSWDWTGLNARADLSETIAAVYAPVGDAWRLFLPTPQPVAGRATTHRFSTKASVLGTKQSRTLANTGVAGNAAGWAFLAGAFALAGVLARRPRRIRPN
ncbi:MAG: hypothetical protein E6G68_06320 [Actinobacteria bacterium]|nr:MAG: hypothetical protein E6G68_06320 [Actinomycetota bacterium]